MSPSYWQASVVSFWLTYVSLFLLLPISTWGVKRLTVNWSSDWTEFFDSSGNPLPQGIHRLIRMELQFNLAISLRLPLKIYSLVSGFP